MHRIGPLILCALAAGCGGATVTGEPDRGGDNLYQLGAAYERASGQNGKPPRALAELKSFAPDLDKISVSPNDNQPYVILWGVDPRSAGATAVLGYEAKGRDGVRYVLTVSGVRKMTDDEFAKADFPPGHKPPGRP